MKEYDIFILINKSLKNEFKKINEIDDVNQRIQKINDLIDKNNTDEEVIYEFLKLKKNTNDKDLKKLLTTYEVCISSEKFNNLFGTIYKISSPKKKLFDLFEKLIQINKITNYDEKLYELINIIELRNDKFVQNFPILYYLNKELYFNSLYYWLLKEIKKIYCKSKENISKEKLHECKQIYLNKLDDLKKKSTKNESDQKEIEKLGKIIENIPICLSNSFLKYIENLSNFIRSIFGYFKTKFESNDIFVDNKYQLNQKKDINLLTDFIFFLIRFDFENSNKIIQYEFIWADTFSGALASQDDLLNGRTISMKLFNNDTLEVKINTSNPKTFTIENVNIYSITRLTSCLVNYSNNLDIFELNNCLKIDNYNTEIFIKKNWNKFSVYVCEILCSPTLKSAFSKTFNFEPIILKNREYVLKILNEIRFFSFTTKFTSETKKRLLLIYIQTYIVNNEVHDIKIKKLIYLAIFLISCFHEIAGNLSLRVYNYIFKKDKEESPIPKYQSSYARKSKKDSGERIEESLFGDYQFKMSIKQILYILDAKNYLYEKCDIFMSGFKNLKDKTLNFSEKLNNLLKLFEISINKVVLNSKEEYIINKGRYNDEILFPPHHSISRLDSNDA